MSGYDSAYSGEYIPHALRTIVSRISNFRKNNLRLQTESQTSAAPGGKIRVNLPTQGLIDLGSLQFSGVVKALSETIKLPHAGVAGLIQRVDVEIGGVVVDSINDYNKLYSMLRVWTVGRPRNRLAALTSCTELAAPFANGDFLETYSAPPLSSEIVDAQKSTKEFCLGREIAAAGEVPFNYSSWLGWLGQHRFLQMDTLPAPVSITITLDSAACTTGAAGGSFELIDIYFNVQAVEFPLLSRSLYAMLERDTPIPMPFTRWINFAMANSNGAVVANRFSVSTQALARVWVQSGLQTAQDRTDQTLTDTIRATDVAKFVSCADGANNFFLEVDNRRTSQYDVDMGRQSVAWVLGQLGVENDTDYECLLGSEGLRTVAGNENGAVATYGSYNYFGSAWALVYSLCFNEYDREDTHNVSGLNTQGMSAAIQHNARVGFTSAATTTYHCETKAVMNILPNRQIEVIY